MHRRCRNPFVCVSVSLKGGPVKAESPGVWGFYKKNNGVERGYVQSD